MSISSSRVSGDGHGGEGFIDVAFVGDDGFDAGGFAGGEDFDEVAFADDSGGEGAGETAEVEVGAEDELDGEAEVGEVAVAGDGDGFELLKESWAVVPGHVFGRLDDVVADEGGHGDE